MKHGSVVNRRYETEGLDTHSKDATVSVSMITTHTCATLRLHSLQPFVEQPVCLSKSCFTLNHGADRDVLIRPSGLLETVSLGFLGEQHMAYIRQ